MRDVTYEIRSQVDDQVWDEFLDEVQNHINIKTWYQVDDYFLEQLHEQIVNQFLWELGENNIFK